MASMREIKRRRDSIRSTEQITKAMKLVATVKLQKARIRAEETRAYSQIMGETVRSLLGRPSPEIERLGYAVPAGAERGCGAGGKTENKTGQGGEKSDGHRKKAVVLITSNRGLAGGYNSNAARLITGNPELTIQNTVIYAVGRKGRDVLAGKGYEIMDDDTSLTEKPEYEAVSQITKKLMEGFEDGRISDIYLAYTQFKNTVIHVPVLQRLIPVEAPPDHQESRSLMEYEPGEEEVLKALIPQYISSLIHGALLESLASENGARMNAMESATQNAEEMIEALELQYNRARQGTITQELTEIIAGAGATE